MNLEKSDSIDIKLFFKAIKISMLIDLWNKLQKNLRLP